MDFVISREQRSGNTLYQELSFQDAEALGEMDEGADITGERSFHIFVCTTCILNIRIINFISRYISLVHL